MPAHPTCRRTRRQHFYRVKHSQVLSFASRLRRLHAVGLRQGPEPELEELDLAYTQLGDTGLMALAAVCPRLRQLAVAQNEGNLWATGMWTEAGLREFSRLRPEVRLEVVC
jgi:hypothetical protein